MVGVGREGPQTGWTSPGSVEPYRTEETMVPSWAVARDRKFSNVKAPGQSEADGAGVGRWRVAQTSQQLPSPDFYLVFRKMKVAQHWNYKVITPFRLYS